MATRNENPARKAIDGSAPKSLNSHPDPHHITAHKEAERLRAHTDDDDVVVPAVTADVDETPRFVRYGAAVLLGLAFGLACYVWINGVPSAPQNPGRTLAFNGQRVYLSNAGIYLTAPSSGSVPAPFAAGQPAVNAGMLADALAEAYNADDASAGTTANGDAATADANAAAASVKSPVVYLFAYDSSEVPETSDLTEIAATAKKYGLSLDVRAYTDEHGRLEYNRRLSERRAKAVADYLVAHGVPAVKISSKGMGPTHAYASDAQDRRAEIAVVRK